MLCTGSIEPALLELELGDWLDVPLRPGSFAACEMTKALTKRLLYQHRIPAGSGTRYPSCYPWSSLSIGRSAGYDHSHGLIGRHLGPEA